MVGTARGVRELSGGERVDSSNGTTDELIVVGWFCSSLTTPILEKADDDASGPTGAESKIGTFSDALMIEAKGRLDRGSEPWEMQNSPGSLRE